MKKRNIILQKLIPVSTEPDVDDVEIKDIHSFTLESVRLPEIIVYSGNTYYLSDVTPDSGVYEETSSHFVPDEKAIVS